ncbi:MAG TPA: hypothetical protein VFY28_01635 [Candidatus Paceibacterota bacterium]|nr:hypothetical protein [Candidatus Paceibacterota bacterium]
MAKSAKALRRIFLERHREWEASNNPGSISSGEMRKRWKKRSTALMNLVRRQQEIRTAPAGKLRLVHVDARDHTPSRHGDYGSLDAVKKALGSMLFAQVLEMKVYDDRGKEVAINWS